MMIQALTTLDDDTKSKLQALVELCREAEGLTLSFPFEDAMLYILCFENEELLSAAAFLIQDEDLYECSAFTAPAYRRRQLFSGILDKALSLLPEESELLFYTDNKSSDTLKVLHALEAEHLNDEYMMMLPLDPRAESFQGAPAAATLPVSVTETTIDGVLTLIFSSQKASLSISVYPSSYYLYGFEVTEGERKKGFGTALLAFTLDDLCKRGPLPVTLQVSSENTAAVALYKKTGFRVSETLSCYLY